MNGDKQHAVWRESIEKYGKETQSIVCMEECSELIQAVSKRLRGKPGATDNLAEEMADVIICLYLLKEMYDITDEQLEEWIARKTARQSKRMQADDPFLEVEAVARKLLWWDMAPAWEDVMPSEDCFWTLAEPEMRANYIRDAREMLEIARKAANE